MTTTAYSNEAWRDIQGYEGYYQISSFGRVRSLDRYLRAVHNSVQIKRGQIIKQTLMPNGYLMVGLNKNMKRIAKYVHRLVAEAFIDNPGRYKEVNHKDEDKTNNTAGNLEWCDHKYNINYGSARKKISKAQLDGGYGRIPIVQLKDGVEIARFASATEAQKTTGIDSSAIRKVCLGRPKFKTAGGYEWKQL